MTLWVACELFVCSVKLFVFSEKLLVYSVKLRVVCSVEVPEHEMLGHQFSEVQLINTSAKAKTWKNLIQGLRVFYQVCGL